ncbi:MAG: ABC transporter permease, partial [Pseudomonas capeferrum]
MNGILNWGRGRRRGPLRSPFATQGRSYKGAYLSWVLPGVIALLWGVASQQHWMSEQILPAPALVWQSAVEFGSGELWGHLW